MFMVDMHAPGVEVRPLRQITDESDFNEVFLDEVPVGADQLVGDLHDGWRVSASTLSVERGTKMTSAPWAPRMWLPKGRLLSEQI